MTKQLPLSTIIGPQWMAILDQLKYRYKTEIVALQNDSFKTEPNFLATMTGLKDTFFPIFCIQLNTEILLSLSTVRQVKKFSYDNPFLSMQQTIMSIGLYIIGQELDSPGFEPRQVQQNHPFSETSRPAPAAIQPSIQQARGVLFARGQRDRD